MDAVKNEADRVLWQVNLLKNWLGGTDLRGELTFDEGVKWKGYAIFATGAVRVWVSMAREASASDKERYPVFEVNGDKICGSAEDAASAINSAYLGHDRPPKSEESEKTEPTFQKHDQDKPRTDLLPPRGVLAVARVLGFGAKKYGADNWHKAAPDEAVRRYTGAMLRHALAMLAGEERDPETGESHAAHAACCALFLAELHERTK